MKVEGVTNASAVVTLADYRTLLFDPWYSDGIWCGSWFNFPPLANPDRYRQLRPDYLYISHIHPDHLDPETLIHYPRETEIWIGDLPHDHLKRAISALGFRNLKIFPLEQPTEHDGLTVTVFGDFAPTALGVPDAVDYALDTSILIQDCDGTQLFNASDNTIQAADAERIAERFGFPEISLIPASGSSLYPHAFPMYSDEEKRKLAREVTDLMCERFLGVSEKLASRWIVPVAGSCVLGGSIAHYSEFLHQPTSTYLRERWHERGLKGSELVTLFEGDILDTATGAVQENPRARFRNFTAEERTRYALTLSDRPLLHEGLALPAGATIPWSGLLATARANLWRHQERLGVFPAWEVVLCAEGAGIAPFCFPLDTPDVPTKNPPRGTNSDRTRFEIDHRLLLLVLLGAVNWNTVEGLTRRQGLHGCRTASTRGRCDRAPAPEARGRRPLPQLASVWRTATRQARALSEHEQCEHSRPFE